MKARFRLVIDPHDHWRDYAELHFLTQGADGSRFYAKPPEMVEIANDGNVIADAGRAPMLTICLKEGDGSFGGPLQNLMDQLWEIGIRPRDIGSPGHLSATQSHLADFRAIVAKTLDIKLP